MRRWGALVGVLAILPALMAYRGVSGMGRADVAAAERVVAPVSAPTLPLADAAGVAPDALPAAATPAPVPSSPAPPEAPAAPSVVATLAVDRVPVYADAWSTVPLSSLDALTSLGSPQALLVTAEVGDRVAVLLPIRPNGSVGWIDRANVAMSVIADEIRVNLAAASVVWMRGAEVLLRSAVAVGAPSTPTPAGRFAVTDIIEGGGAYGPAIVALTGYSEAMETFNGGLPRLALHGTDDPSSIGRQSSFGCVRLPNDLIVRLAAGVPIGTPVYVS